MGKIKAKPMQIKSFLLFWLLAIYLLWPLLIIPVSLAIYILPPYYEWEWIDWGYQCIYWCGMDNKAIQVAAFTIAMAFVQEWMFKRFLYLRIPYWRLGTIVGGLLGTLAMWLLRWNPPFEMFAWFLGISIAQYLLLRSWTKNAWLWLLAQLALSVFFPIYADEWWLVVGKWLVSTSAYATATLLVLRELGKSALAPVYVEEETAE